MRTLKNNIYKNIASILCSDHKEYKTARNIIVFSRILSLYPSKSLHYIMCDRALHFIEKNVHSVSLMIEIMRDEGEDEEIISNIEMLHDNPTIKNPTEVSKLCSILADYIKYAKILTVKNTFLSTMDMINEDDETHIKENVDMLYQLSSEISNAYNEASITEESHMFDSANPDIQKTVIAQALDDRKPDKVILTGIRALNQLLSPGYLSGCLYVYAALPGNYKSGILLTSHVDCCKYNPHIKNVTGDKTPVSIYISMENTMTQTVVRLWSILFPTADISMFTPEESVDMINKALCENGMRSVILYYGYREKSTADVAQIIQSYNDDKYEVVALFLDYIKRIRPARCDEITRSSDKGELNAIMNEIKSNICVRFNIPCITAHQLNRAAATAVDAVVANGGYNKTDEAVGRSNVGSAWEIMEVADFLGLINIENNGETKMLMIKAAKQRDIVNETDNTIVAIRHPFLSTQSFALKSDINETVSLSIPIYIGKRSTNFMANI